VRPDVDRLLHGVGGSAPPPLRFDPDTDPLYFTDHPNWNNPQLALVPMGLAFRVVRRDRPIPPAFVPKDRLDGELDRSVPKDYLTQNLIGQFHYMLGNTLERSDWPRARREYEEAMRAAPHNDVLFFNLGLIFAGSGLYDEAIAAFRRSGVINPRPVAGPVKLRAYDRVPALEDERRRIESVEMEMKAEGRLEGVAPRSAEWHRRLAALFEVRGERVAALGHERRALEAERRR
jgi:tetratricopeptide (TPR) repeat protein